MCRALEPLSLSGDTYSRAEDGRHTKQQWRTEGTAGSSRGSPLPLRPFLPRLRSRVAVKLEKKSEKMEEDKWTNNGNDRTRGMAGESYMKAIHQAVTGFTTPPSLRLSFPAAPRLSFLCLSAS